MSDNQKPLIDKPAEATQTPAEPPKPKPPSSKVVFARRIHNMISVQFIVIMLLVYLSFLSETLIKFFDNIWLVFGVTICFVAFGVYMVLSIMFRTTNTVVTVLFIIFLTLSMAFFIVYLAASAGSPNAGYIAAFLMAFLNIVYSLVAEICSDPIMTEVGIVTAFGGALTLVGILLLADVYLLETPIEEVSYLALGIIFFVSVLYGVYIFFTVKGMADGSKEAISEEDYTIAAITVYLDFSIGLIIAISRQICSLLAS